MLHNFQAGTEREMLSGDSNDQAKNQVLCVVLSLPSRISSSFHQSHELGPFKMRKSRFHQEKKYGVIAIALSALEENYGGVLVNKKYPICRECVSLNRVHERKVFLKQK